MKNDKYSILKNNMYNHQVSVEKCIIKNISNRFAIHFKKTKKKNN